MVCKNQKYWLKPVPKRIKRQKIQNRGNNRVINCIPTKIVGNHIITQPYRQRIMNDDEHRVLKFTFIRHVETVILESFLHER